MSTVQPGQPTFLSLGLTPALQRTLILDRFQVGGVNRAREIRLSAAGKGVNVGMALARLGCRAWVTGFIGGDSGRAVERDARSRGTMPAFTRQAANTRVCDTIIDRATGTVTELVEEAPPIGAAHLARFKKAALTLERRCDGLAISGTVPPSLAGRAVYTPFAELAQQLDLPWVIDSHRGDLQAVLAFRPLVAKMNVEELAGTVPMRGRGGRAILAAARRLTAAGARHAFITDGPRPAWLVADDGRAWTINPPDAGPVVNPIGSGDCVTAALLAAVWRGRSVLQAARYGLACGSANTNTAIPARFDPEPLERLARAAAATRIA